MLKKLIFLVIFLILSSSVFAVSIDFYKGNYKSKETVQAEIDFGNLTLLEGFKHSNVFLYGEEEIPLALNIYELGENKYFLYFNLPELSNRTYNFLLKDIFYSTNGELRKESFSKNLSVVKGVGVSINPALFYLDIENWENPRLGINIKNNLDEEIVLSFSSDSKYVEFSKEEYSLDAGEEYVFRAILNMREYPEKNFRSELVINYGNSSSYKVPIIVNKLTDDLVSEGGEVQEEEKGELKFTENIEKVERNLSSEEIVEGSLGFKNSGNKTLYNFDYSLTGDLSDIIRIEYDGDSVLEQGEEDFLYLYINEGRNLNKDYSGKLIINADEGYSDELPINIFYRKTEEKSNQPDEEDYEIEPYNYSDISDKETTEKESNFWLYFIFVILFLILIGAGYYLYNKSKPEEKKFDSLIKSYERK